ncbi:MAG: hypothetical protein QXF48_02030 [Candidatus Anstonellaceae archaeon]
MKNYFFFLLSIFFINILFSINEYFIIDGRNFSMDPLVASNPSQSSLQVSINITTNSSYLVNNISLPNCSVGANFTNTSEIVVGEVNWSTNCTLVVPQQEGSYDLYITAYFDSGGSYDEYLTDLFVDYSPPYFFNYSSTNILEQDIFYSPAQNNNLVHIKIGATDNASDISNATVIFMLENGTQICGPIDLASFEEFWYNEDGCNVGDFIQSHNITIPTVALAVVNATDAAGHSSNISIPFILHNLGAIQGPPEEFSLCFREGEETTNLSEVLDFKNVNLVKVIELNGSASCSPLNQSLPWGNTFKKVAMFNFSSIDISTPQKAAAVANAIGNLIHVNIGRPFSFEASRIFVNSTAASYLNTSAKVVLYDLPFSSTPNVIYDEGEFDGTIQWSQGPFNQDYGFFTGNLTININKFSGYNISDLVEPSITISSPSKSNYSSTPIINITANGTSSAISNLTIILKALNGSTLNTFVYLFNSTNSANCTNSTPAWDEINCILSDLSLGRGIYKLEIYAKDFGGQSGNLVNTSVLFGINNSAPVLVNNLTLVQNQPGHKAIFYALVSDEDGAIDIVDVSMEISDPSIAFCTQISNSTSNNLLNVSFLCRIPQETIYNSQNFSINVTFRDNLDASVNTSTTTASLPNFAPNISSLNLMPPKAFSFTNLTCIIEASDPDNDTIKNYSYKWYKNGELISSFYSDYNNATLSSQNFSALDNITCEVKVSDEFDLFSQQQNISITILEGAGNYSSLNEENRTNQTFILHYNNPSSNASVSIHIANNTSINNLSSDYTPGLIFIHNVSLSSGDLAVNNSRASNFSELTILLGPAGLRFSPNITVQFNYSALNSTLQQQIENLLGAGNLLIKKCKDDGSNCISVPIISYNTTTKTINVSIDSFSVLGLYDNTPSSSQSSSSSSTSSSTSSSYSGGGIVQRSTTTPPLSQEITQPPLETPLQQSKEQLQLPTNLPTPPQQPESKKEQEQQSSRSQSSYPAEKSYGQTIQEQQVQSSPQKTSENLEWMIFALLVVVIIGGGVAVFLFGLKKKRGL